MSLRTVRAAVVVALVLLAVTTVHGQQFVVRSSDGNTELLSPEANWLQAVTGRLIPSGSTVVVWVGGELTAGFLEGDEKPILAAEELTVFVVASLGPELAIDLLAGSLTISTVDMAVVVAGTLGTIVGADARFVVDSTSVAVSEGAVTVTLLDGSQVVVEAGADFNLEPPGPVPIL